MEPEPIDTEQILCTARLRLEPLLPSHAPRLFPVLADARIYPYLPEEPPADEAALRRRYALLAARGSPDGTERWLNWAVWRAQEADYIGVLQATVEPDQRAAIAYLLHPAAWGRGYAQEGCRRLLALLFATYGVAQVYAEVDTRNRASCRLLERLGFARAAVRAGADHFKGAPSDEYTYTLSAEGWRARDDPPTA